MIKKTKSQRCAEEVMKCHAEQVIKCANKVLLFARPCVLSSDYRIRASLIMDLNSALKLYVDAQADEVKDNRIREIAVEVCGKSKKK